MVSLSITTYGFMVYSLFDRAGDEHPNTRRTRWLMYNVCFDNSPINNNMNSKNNTELTTKFC